MENVSITSKQFHSFLFDGMSVMFGGINGQGMPDYLVSDIISSKVKNLTLIGHDINNHAGIKALIENEQVDNLIISGIDENEKELNRLIKQKEISLELLTKSTLIERIHCGGNGLGGFLTRSGIGTAVEAGKRLIDIDGTIYIIELPLRADLAIVDASIADTTGNLIYDLKTRHLNPMIVCAADTVIAQCNKIVNFGQLQQNFIITSGAFVDYLYCPSMMSAEGTVI